MRVLSNGLEPLPAIDMIRIRPFRNDDLNDLHRIWCEHWDCANVDTTLTRRQLEHAIFSRIYFGKNRLHIAVLNDVPVGWCQQFTEEHSGASSVVPSLCVGMNITDEQRTLVAAVLIDACQQAVTSEQPLQFGAGSNWDTGYSGLPPLGPGVGIPSFDTLLCQTLEAKEFATTQQFTWFRVRVSEFRPPINREFLNLRRSSKVQYVVGSSRPQRIAQSLSHLDEKQIRLVDMQGNITATLELYLSDRHAEVMESDSCMVRLDQETQDKGLTNQQMYLLTTLIRDAASHQLRYVNLSVAVDGEHQLLHQLRSIQFEVVQSGSIWSQRGSNGR